MATPVLAYLRGARLKDATTLQNAVAADGNGTALEVDGSASVLVQITGTFSATVNFEITLDGTNFVAVEAVNLNTGAKGTSTTTTGLYVLGCPGAETFQARVSGYSSGSVTVVARATPFVPASFTADVELSSSSITIGEVDQGAKGDAVSDAWYVQGSAADGAAIPSENPLLVAGHDGTLVQTLSTDSTGRQNVNLISGQAGVAAGAGAVDATVQRITLASDDPAVTALQIMDDWDESDRAKVNPVVGQAGLAGGTGVDAANALRVSLATDIPLPAGTNAIGKLAANSGVDIGDVDVTSEPATAADGAVGLPAVTKVVSGYDGANVQAVSTNASGHVNIADGGNSITVDNSTLSVVGGGAEATALRVTLADESLSALETITVDFEGDATDLDSGAGTDNHAVIAIGLPASGGHVVGGTSTDPIRVDPTGTTTQPVSDADGSLTIDNTTLSVVGSGTEATALRVTIATDSTGVLSVDDNAGSLTVDATDLDIRDLTAASDSVRIGDGTDLANVTAAGELNVLASAQPGVDIGDVTINNASGASAVNIQDGGNSITVDNAALSVTGSGTEATALRVTVATDSTGVLSVDDNGGSLTIDGSVNIAATTTGGHSPSLKNALTNSVSSVKSSAAGTLAGWYIYNPNTSVAYVQIFDVATAGGVTLGTTPPNLSLGIPPGSGANLLDAVGIAFANGIQVAATTTATGNTAPSTALDANFMFK